MIDLHCLCFDDVESVGRELFLLRDNLNFPVLPLCGKYDNKHNQHSWLILTSGSQVFQLNAVSNMR
jgi:hypothetical protein